MFDNPNFAIISRNDDNSSVRILIIFSCYIINFRRFLDIFQNNISFLNKFNIVGLLVGDFQQKLSINCQEMDAISIY